MWCVVFGCNAEMCEKFCQCDRDGVSRWVGHGRVKSQALQAHAKIGEIRVTEWAGCAESEMGCVPVLWCSI